MSIYGLLIGIAIYLGVSQFQSLNKTIPKSLENRFILLLLIFSVIGARLYHVADFWQYYKTHLSQIPNTRAGGLGIYGALIASFFYLVVFCFKHRLNILSILNIITPSLAIGQSIGRLGNYFNTEVFGKPTYIDFGQYVPINFRPDQYINYSYFHPIWLYESILLFFVYLFIKNKKQSTAWYFLLFGLIRFSLDFLRFDTWVINQIKISQIVSLLLIALGTILLFKKSPKPIFRI
jgi:phosphatidylglycerol---prolipoprotein diacylglyceryl transferase